MEAGFTITKQGWHLLAKLLAGDKLEISKIMVGSGKVQEGVNPGEITELVQPVALATSTVPQVADKQVSFIVEYRNDLNGGLAEGFWLNEFGVYANDPDEGEVLLYYATMGDYPQYVAAYNGQAVDVRRYPVVIALSECYNVELKPPAGAWVTFEELAETLKRRGYHSNSNLLINGDFRKPVNRNGKREYTTIGNHFQCIDRWFLYNSSCTILENGVDFVGSFAQETNHKEIAGKLCTLSIFMSDGTLIYGSAIYPTYGNVSIQNIIGETDKLAIAQFKYNIHHNYQPSILIEKNSNYMASFIAIKLELGSVQTLAHKDENGNWVLNDPPNYDLQYALCNQYSPITGEFVGSQHSNPNLLDNWYFADPINQRGQTEYTASGYTIDRWRLWSGVESVTLHNGYITLTALDNANGYYRQTLSENLSEYLFGKIVSLSFLFQNNEFTTIAGTIPNGTIQFLQTPYSKGAIFMRNENGVLSVSISAQPANFTEIIAAKLELGPVQTLAHKDENGNWILNDPPPNKVLELAKCQRYFERLYLPRGFILFNNKTNSLVANLFYTPKRTTPTITAQSMYVVRVSDNTGVYGPFVFTTPEFIDSPSKNGCVMNFGDAQVNTIGVGSTAYIADESYIDISADL
jgi:hypothetical protein